MQRKIGAMLLALLLIICQLPQIEANAAVITNELKISSEITQWVLDEPTNTLYAISQVGQALYFINATTMSIEKTMTLNARPTDIIKDNGKLYISFEINQVVVVDMTSRAVSDTLRTTSDTCRIVKDGNKLYYTEYDQWCDIYEYDLLTKQDKMIASTLYEPDLAINTKDHILYIGESGLSGSNIAYYSAVENRIIGKSNYDRGYGFPYPKRVTLFDGTNVYYAGREFNPDLPYRFNGDFGGAEEVICANNGLVYTSKSIYDKDSHVRLGDYSSSVTLVETSNNSIYVYSRENGIIKRYSDSSRIIDRSNIITLISGTPAVSIQVTGQSVQLNEDTSMLQMNSKLIQWEMDEASNTLYGISNVDKAVFFVNAQSLNLEKSLTFKSRPTDVIRDRGKIYVALDDVNQIAVIDMKTRTVIDTLYTTSDPYRIVKDGDKLYYTERAGWCKIYEYSLTAKTDKALSIETVSDPDIAINPYEHILYIGESGSSGSDMYYYSTITNTVISKTTYDGGYGFPFPARRVLFDGERVYYAGCDFDRWDASKILGTYNEEILSAEYGIVFTKNYIYDSETHELLGDAGGASLYEISNHLVLYLYDEVRNAIVRVQPNPMPILVTFDSQLGVVLEYIVEPNTTVSAPFPPTRTGYTFGGWYKEPECINAWDFANDIVTQDITLYAKWLGKEDTNHDGKVDMLDLAQIAKQYNTASGKTGWNSSFDLNNDGAVNIYDLVIVSKFIKPAQVRSINKEQARPASNIGRIVLESMKKYK